MIRLQQAMDFSLQFPIHPMPAWPTSLPDGSFCLICHPHPDYPSHLLCSSLSRILGPFGTRSDGKHIRSPDFWVTSEIGYMWVSHKAMSGSIFNKLNAKCEEYWAVKWLPPLKGQIYRGHEGKPLFAPHGLYHLSFPPAVRTLCFRRNVLLFVTCACPRNPSTAPCEQRCHLAASPGQCVSQGLMWNCSIGVCFQGQLSLRVLWY